MSFIIVNAFGQILQGKKALLAGLKIEWNGGIMVMEGETLHGNL
jgi:hypothetical protein